MSDYDKDMTVGFFLGWITIAMLIGVAIGIQLIKPTRLPKDCILYSDVIYCEEVSK